VDNDLSVHEEFIGLYVVNSIESSSLFHVIKDTLLRLNLPMTKICGQCYDGASNMRGVRNGVAKLIQDEEPRGVFTHCYGHSLSLAAKDTIQGCKTFKNSLEITHEITKLVKYSPRRESLFNEIKEEIEPGSPGIRTLCPTRWTVRADAMESIIKNYQILQELWEKATDIIHDTETVARIRGVASQMSTFDFFFDLVFGEILLRHTDNLSRTLQKPCSASEGQIIADMTKRTLQEMRTDENFVLFWKKVSQMASTLEVSDPVLPRKQKVPKRFEIGSAPPKYCAEPKDHYRRIYFEGLDLLVQAISDRFDQPGYCTYLCLQELMLKAVNKEDFSTELTTVCNLYGSDLHAANLKMQLEMLGDHFSGNNVDIFDVKKYLQDSAPAVKTLFSEVTLLMKLILVLPATNATSERSFSAMRRVKSHLRATMGQEQLNNLMVLHVHKELTEKLILSDIANEFISKCP